MALAFRFLRHVAHIKAHFRKLKLASLIFASLNLRRQIFVSWADYIK